MSNTELIDDYLTNKLSDTQREVFEQQLASDPTLKADVEFQRQIIDGLQKARAAELKSMLRNIPISSREFTTLKVAAGIVGGALLIGTVYWLGNNKPELPVTEPKDSIGVITETENSLNPALEDVVTNQNEQPAEVEPESNVQPKTSTNTAKKEVAKPTIDVIDPSAELVESTSSPISQGATQPVAPAVEAKSLEVNIDSTSKKYKFHYQFADGKVVLYGSFDRSLYEILELNGGKHSVYLFYQSKYYFLNEQSTAITPLDVITDKATISKLETYRKK
ncbi:MAG TPA: hypothetical protein PLM56_11945 [Cyclobacteriaceae bacterium]|nr:hypothetical protein [Cytophagales bacterium]HMR58778.1 hypothetical protein [Cyclobacteriaceae bacterium]HRE66927.1 hypothetical protein [Cyclobacteriaceae bacterium]HRF34204.1 hypothetical protein [Cyclobacteriaceae bacterium]